MSYDTKTMRIVRIFHALVNGEHISMRECAKEFNVDLRTIQRDINQRLGFLPIQKDKEGKCFLQAESLGKLGFKDIREFARVSGIWGLFPSLDDKFIGDLLHIPLPDYWDNHSKDPTPIASKSSPFAIKNQGFEDISAHKDMFMLLARAILKQHTIHFSYKSTPRQANPYRLLNNNGIWYLLADESGTLKHFTFTHIKHLRLEEARFKPSPAIESIVEKSSAKWVNPHAKSATLQIQNTAKEYFMRKAFISNIRLDSHDATHFYITCEYSYDDEILNLAKMFLPFIIILEPAHLQKQLNQILQEYLSTTY